MMPSTVKLRLVMRLAKRMLEFLAFGLLDRGVLRVAGTAVPVAGRTAIVQLELLGDFFSGCPSARCSPVLWPAGEMRVILVCPSECVALAALSAVGWAAEFSDRPWMDRVAGGVPIAGFCGHCRARISIAALPGFWQSAGYSLLRVLWRAGGGMPRTARIRAPICRSCRAFRSWPAERFAALARRILQRQPGWKCIVAGTAAERDLARSIAGAIGPVSGNRAGETLSGALLDLIAGASLVLGNDSAAGHMAAYCGTLSVVAVGGGHFGRCYPYDSAASPITAMPVTVHESMDCFGCDWLCRYRTAPDVPYPCAQAISVDAMWRAVEPLLVPVGERGSRAGGSAEPGLQCRVVGLAAKRRALASSGSWPCASLHPLTSARSGIVERWRMVRTMARAGSIMTRPSSRPRRPAVLRASLCASMRWAATIRSS